MTERKYTDEEVMRAIDICDKLDFFGGQRAGRELWFTKPVEVQNADIMKFAEDIAFVKEIINRQMEDIDRLNDINEHLVAIRYEARAEAVKEFAEKLKQRASMTCICNHRNGTKEITSYQFSPTTIDNLVKEMTEGKPCTADGVDCSTCEHCYPDGGYNECAVDGIKPIGSEIK